ncbi:MAG: RNHCP domain-containing protein [Parcubacteria group bacterium]|nr:RNHCP domain-containing protein [Parcubacteria group bacterium]MCR4342318.1 RNHCP domain-containing protein [Patescibacteria group bacterium]
MTKKFQRNIEDFVCGHCGARVRGNGYTNHCPKCLWSKHVDVNPGDRGADCGGMMKPVSAEQKSGEWRILHKCEKCGHEKINRLSKDDDFDKVTKM